MSDEPRTPTEPTPGDAGPLPLSEVLESRRAALLAFIERRLGPTLRGKVEPQDVLQEVAVKAIREAPTNVTDPFSWLCRLAEQCIIDAHRRFATSKRAVWREQAGHVTAGEGGQDLVAMISASMTSPSAAAVRNEHQLRLDAALEALPEDQREVLRLRYGEGLATRDIALRLGKTDGAVRVLLSRILASLRTLLDTDDSI